MDTKKHKSNGRKNIFRLYADRGAQLSMAVAVHHSKKLAALHLQDFDKMHVVEFQWTPDGLVVEHVTEERKPRSMEV